MIQLCCEYLSVRCIWLHVLVMSRTRYRVNSHCLNVKELLARNRCEAWSLSDCKWTWTHNHLVHNRTPSHLAKLAKWPKWFRACFEQRVPWHSGNYRVWIHSKTCAWHDKNIQWNINHFITSLSHMREKLSWKHICLILVDFGECYDTILWFYNQFHIKIDRASHMSHPLHCITIIFICKCKRLI